ncbi:MAG: M28 family peptidase [Chitinophagales bacterium]|nr:M28 family peptidase [Bacteroidota bacterium]MCB9043913.1 M28 family peptidase [Chitinophagales bacterium]
MKIILYAFIVYFSLFFTSNPPAIKPDTPDDQALKAIYDEALNKSWGYTNLEHLCKNIGPRLSGSESAATAVTWSSDVLRKLSDTVYLQQVEVPVWERGKKTEAEALLGNNDIVELDACALGGSVATLNNRSLTAEVVEVKSSKDLLIKGKDAIKDKIVFYNCEMDPTLINNFEAYDQAMDECFNGTGDAAQYGAQAVLVRSLTHAEDEYPHTQTITYKDPNKKIPALALSTKSANFLRSAIATDDKLKVTMQTDCTAKGTAKSHNVIAEIKGSKYPNEVILVSAYLDSWDLGEGAQANGAGAMHAMEVLYLFKKLKIQPQHTIRCVLYTNSLFGGAGAKKYAEEMRKNREKHILAIESDRGGFVPQGFNIGGTPLAAEATIQQLRRYAYLFKPYNLFYFEKGETGADIEALKTGDVPLISLFTESQRYFDYHNAATDVYENVNKRELELGSASIASLVYLIDKYGLPMQSGGTRK